MWKRSVTSPKDWNCSRPYQTPLNVPSKNSRCKSPWVRPDGHQGLWAAPEVEKAYTRARELCEQMGETPQLFPVLYGLCQFYTDAGRHMTAHELGEQLFTLAQRHKTQFSSWWPILRWGRSCTILESLLSPRALGAGDCPLRPPAAPLLSLSLRARPRGELPDLCGLCPVASGLSRPGTQESHEALTLAQELTHPFSLAIALATTATVPSVAPGGAGMPKSRPMR